MKYQRSKPDWASHNRVKHDIYDFKDAQQHLIIQSHRENETVVFNFR